MDSFEGCASRLLPGRRTIARESECGTFAEYLWRWVDGTPVVNHPTTMSELPARTELSDAVGKDLKKRGFTFVGSTIVYSYLQSCGLVDDHLVGCPAKPT